MSAAVRETACERAAVIPEVTGLAKLAAARFAGLDVRETYRELADQLSRDDTNVAPLMDIAILDQLLGSPERGVAVQAAALRGERLFRVSSARPPTGLTLLGFAMAGPLNANIPVEFLIEDSDVSLYLLYIVPGEPLPPIPEHDLAIVLAAESEAARAVLAEIERVTSRWSRPVLDRAELVPLLGRESLYRLMDGAPGVAIPPTVRVDSATLAAIGSGSVPISACLPRRSHIASAPDTRIAIPHTEDFPIIVRPIDSHGGKGLVKLNSSDEIARYMDVNPAAEYFLSPFVDYRSPDGFFRKYRIAVIDGKPYPSHLAISEHWMVHFLNSGMTDSEAMRCEEERFMDDFDNGFSARHGAAFQEMADRSGLEYFGVDCGETPDGQLLVFEADTSLIVHNMDSPALFPYKGRHMNRLFAAFRAMLYRKAGLLPAA